MCLSVKPILIVGTPRSGTELVRAILNNHPDIFISAETHYFDDLRPRLPSGKLEESDRDHAFRYFMSLRANTYGFGEMATNSDLAVDDVFRSLAKSLGGSADAIFVAHCRSQEAARGKKVWGEKTPRHLFRSEDILKAFPDARILVMLRDPRGVAASYRDWNKRWLRRQQIEAFSLDSIGREQARVRMSYNLTILALLWRSAAKTALRLQRNYGTGRIFVCRFEDVAAEPQEAVRNITKWIGVDYDSGMLNVGVVNSTYVEHESGQSVDSTIADRWRAKLTPDEAAYIDWLVGPTATRLGYAKSNHDLRPSFVLQQLSTLPVSVVRAIAANRHRIGKIGAFLAARLGGLIK
jgi:hypothetical protein